MIEQGYFSTDIFQRSILVIFMKSNVDYTSNSKQVDKEEADIDNGWMNS